MENERQQYPIASELYEIEQQHVTNLDHEVSNGESWNYYCNGQVINPIVFKNEISGIVREYLKDYKVQIKIDEHEMSCLCTCDSEDTVCKHIVALLYSWVYDHEEFVNVGEVITQLQDMDRDMLIKVVERFLTDDPQNIKFFNKQRDLELSEFEIDGLAYE